MNREKIVRQNMYAYQRYVEEWDEFRNKALTRTPEHDGTGVRGSTISDPTARGAVMLADMNDTIRKHMEWVAAVDDAMEECVMLDQGHENGFAYVLRENTRKRFGRSRKVIRRMCCAECGISDRTYYDWLSRITMLVQLAAERRGLLNGEKE